MRSELTPLARALDAAAVPIAAFVRDDDAGWADAELLALIDTLQRCGVPMDLAVIPAAISEPLAHKLGVLVDDLAGLLGVHQHGHTHTNHQPEGRKAEFGNARAADEQRQALTQGRERLQQLFGSRLQPLFTPPWNRCAPCTPGLLAELGFAALSRDRGATPQQALPELPVDVDWSRQHREGGAAAVVAALAQAIGERAADGRPLGLMLHHAVMSAEERSLLAGVLDTLSLHPRLKWHPMAALLKAAPTPTLLKEHA